jgi:LAO/AO transport system kinase
LKIDDIARGILEKDSRAISRAITLVENDGEDHAGREIIKRIYNQTGRAKIIGITGPPGVGKSTIIGNLCTALKNDGRKVAVLAVDASSPFTNGTFLGNRIRMQDTLFKNDIFMRSLSTRGSTGGLSTSIWDSVRILDAAGFDIIIIETVGAGQADLDILDVAHTILVVLAPGLGDEIQAIKAGIMEIASIFVVNKVDREDSLIAIKDIEDSLSLLPQGTWKVPVVGLDSIKVKGYEELIKMIDLHFSFSESALDKNERLVREVTEILRNDFNIRIKKVISRSKDKIAETENGTDPYTIADELSKKILNSES